MNKSEYIISNENNSLSLSLPSSSFRSPKSEKLQALYSRKLATQHLQVMSNRVNQLQKVKNRTQKEIEKLRQDIINQEERIDQKNQYKERKRRLSDFNQDTLQMRRISNKKSREDRKKKIHGFIDSLLKEKQGWVKEKKQKTVQWQEEILQNKSKDIGQKNKNYKKLKSGYVNSLRDRCINHKNHIDKIKSRYSSSIEQEKRMESEAFEKISELEETENSLIESLSLTMQMRKSLKQDLQRLRNLSI